MSTKTSSNGRQTRNRGPGPQLGGRASSGRRLPTTTRSYGAITGGILLLVVSALLGAVVFSQAGQTSSVLAVRDQVAEGQTITRGDLISKQVSGVDDAVAVADVDTVVGKTAAGDLVAGQVITTNAVTGSPVPGGGRALVGLALTPAQMPGDGLAPGDLVRVVAVPSADSPDASLQKTTVLASSAQVYSITGGSEGDAGQVVTVIASSSDAEPLATYSAAGRLAVIKIANPDAEAVG